MKRFWRIVSIALICGALTTPQIDAQGRNHNGRNRSVSSSSSRGNASRPSSSNSSRPGNNSTRPGGNHGSNSNAPKPGNDGYRRGGNHGGNSSAPKPGNNGYRPGGNHGSNNNTPKPGNNGYRPGGNHGSNSNAPKPGNNGYRPGGDNHRPAPRPDYGHAHHNAPHHNHAVRPHCPPPRPYYRPTPPPSFRPYHGCPVFKGIFGITFGTAINLSLDYLYRNSYTVYGYDNDVIYLRNVDQYGYMWPDATLYYGVNGLTGSQFMYSTNYNSRSRYDSVYNTLYGQYGAPISVQNSANGIIATWWGYDGQYISLEYRPIYTNNGQLRYFTTLSLGM